MAWNASTVAPFDGVFGAHSARPYQNQLHVFLINSFRQLEWRWWDGNWHSDVIYEYLVGAGGSPCAIEHGGQLHVFYETNSTAWAAGTDGLGHAWLDGKPPWHFEILHEYHTNGMALTATSYAGQLHFFANVIGNFAIDHGWWDGQWNFEDLDVDEGNNPSSTAIVGKRLWVVGSGRFDPYYPKLRCGVWDQGAWHFATLDQGNGTNGDCVSAAYGGQFHVFSRRGGPVDPIPGIRHGWWDEARPLQPLGPGGWHFETMDEQEFGSAAGKLAVVNYDAQLDLFVQGANPGGGFVLRHHSWNGNRWNAESLDQGVSEARGVDSSNLRQSATRLKLGT
jgi:hypothetical protein